MGIHRSVQLCCIPGCEHTVEAPTGELALCVVHASLEPTTLRKLTGTPSFDPLVPALSVLPERRAQVPEERPKATDTQGVKYDGGKPRPALLFNGMPYSVAQLIEVLSSGAKKYADDNWKIVPNGHQRYSDALYRHLLAWSGGEVNDPETGLPHLAHAACNIMFLMELEQAALTEKK